MGQAKARGTQAERIAEAVERAKERQQLLEIQREAERKAVAEARAAAQAKRDAINAERIARGLKPVAAIGRNGRGLRMAMLAGLSLASISAVYK